MNKSGSDAVVIKRKVNASTTLNRKYVSRPNSKRDTSDIAAEYKNNQILRRKAIAEQMNRAESERLAAKSRGFVQAPRSAEPAKAAEETPLTPAVKHPLQITASETMRMKKSAIPEPAKKSASELKEAAIKKALADIAKDSAEEKSALKARPKFGFWRIILALSCATASVFAIGYLIRINMPDFSLRVAAMQTGIEATYPSYRCGHSLGSITSENGKISMEFHNDKDGKKFVITEEKSSWDSTALLNNYVKQNFDKDYITVREQGLTIYIDSEEAAWVNGGIVYKMDLKNDSLTKNQIRSIATSFSAAN